MAIEIICGDALSALAGLPAASVHCCITSPPYYALRDYGTATWEGGEAGCDHRESRPSRTAASVAASGLDGGTGNVHRSHIFRGSCGRCGAQRIDAQIGTEATPQDYVAHLTEVFRGVWRVLRDDGTCWVVIGDSYAGFWGNQGRKEERGTQRPIDGPMLQQCDGRYPSMEHNTGAVPAGLKPKDLMMIPHRVALALQADGWYVRNDCVWAKGSAMPESVQDRFSRAHEFVFHLAKSERYYFDPIAVAEPAAEPERRRHERIGGATGHLVRHSRGGMMGASATRNRRSVLHINPQPFSAADFGVKDIDHYAVMPEKLVEILTLCSTSEAGCCPRCLAPWRRVVERTAQDSRRVMRTRNVGGRTDGFTRTKASGGLPPVDVQTTGWAPGCRCLAGPPVPCRVLDIFCGSGTTGLVAKKLGRDFTGIELNESYVRLSEKRIASVPEPLFSAAALADEGAAAR